MDEEREEQQDEVEFGVPIFWDIEGVLTRYATNLVVQSNEFEITIMFFEIKSPVVLGTSEQQQDQYQKLPAIRGECVSRVVVSPKRMGEFIKVLTAHMERYDTKFGQE